MFNLINILFFAFYPFNYAFIPLTRRNLLLSSINTKLIDTYSSDNDSNNNNIYQLFNNNDKKYNIDNYDKKYNIDNDDDNSNSYMLNIQKNNMYFSGQLNDQSVFTIMTNLLALQQRDYQDINLHIQSGGGSLLPSLNLVDIIRSSNVPIYTYIDGYAASAATLISIVGTNRFINKHGVMLIHQLKMGNEFNKYNEIKDFSENSDTLMNIIKNIYTEYSNINSTQLDYLLNHDLWLNSTTSKQYGFVDIII